MKKQQKYAIMVSALAVLIIAVASGPAHATSLTLIDPTTKDGSFETAAAGDHTVTLGDGFWTVSATGGSHVSVFDGGGSGASEGTQWLQLENSDGAPTVSQNFVAVAGHQYELSFDYTAYNGSAVGRTFALTYTIGDALPTTINTPSVGPYGEMGTWQSYAAPLWTADVTSTVTLSFVGDSAASGYYGTSLDNVVLNDITPPPPVPEPATFALLLLGGGMIFFRRRSAS